MARCDTILWTCPSCGREFDDQKEGPCPSDECPSHWEEKGTPHPDYACKCPVEKPSDE